MKRVVLLLLLLFVALVAVLAGRTVSRTSMQITAPAAPPLKLDRAAALARFVRAIQFQTVSYAQNAQPVEHDAFVAWVAQAYPRVHASLRRELVNGRTMFFTWPGSDRELAPVLLMGHYDVVPVEAGTESKWEQPPFSGAVRDGFVWGRGTLDDKVTVISLLESADILLGEGFHPKRTILFAFGHDEELGGANGAAHVAKLLASRGVRLHAVIDEGGAVMAGGLAGLTKPTAVIGIAEKGIASVELLASGSGGHSSMPPPRTPVGMVARAVDRVQSHPFPTSVSGATREFFRWLAPEMPFRKRVVMSNLWLFEPLLAGQAKAIPSLNAMMRTTTAPTLISGGVKDNVIPTEARAVINFRILPGDTVASVVQHVRDVVNDSDVRTRLASGGAEPSPISDPNAGQFRVMQRTIAETYPDMLVAPYLVVGATDARYFAELTPNVYRFVPVSMTDADLKRFHGLNERVRVDDYFAAIRFFRTLLVNFAG